MTRRGKMIARMLNECTMNISSKLKLFVMEGREKNQTLALSKWRKCLAKYNGLKI
jgi:hypothetical protein